MQGDVAVALVAEPGEHVAVAGEGFSDDVAAPEVVMCLAGVGGTVRSLAVVS
jgi:hypothetical protein